MKKLSPLILLLLAIGCNSETKKNTPRSNNHENTSQTDDIIIGDKAILIDQHLQKLAHENGFSGSIFISRNDSLIFCKGYGKANRKAELPFTPRTLCSIGSITKAFTATAILKLYSQGKLKLNDPISLYFPNAPKDKKNITLHQLLTHSSGFHEFLEQDGGDYEEISAEEFVARVFKEPLAFKPGTKAVYTNVGMSLLGIIIEKISGKDYETFLSESFFEPVGIKTIGYHAQSKDSSNLAIGYQRDEYWGTLMQRYQKNNGGPYWNLKANGGLYATTLDMFEWSKLVNNATIIPDSIKTLMFTKHVAEEGYGGLSFFGYGCNVGQSKRGTLFIDNGGSNGIYFARLIRFPEEGLVFYIATNNSVLNANLVLPQITQLYFDGHIAANPVSQLDQWEFEGSGFIYTTLMEKGGAYFTKNIFSDLKQKGLPTQDDMLFLEAGQKLITQGKWDEALILYEFYTQNFPQIVVAWNDLGEIYLQKGNKTKAKNCFETALKLKPENQRAQEMLKKL